MNQPPGSPKTPARASLTVNATADLTGSARAEDVERAIALRDVMDHAVRVQKEISGVKRLGPSRARLILTAVICVPLLALCVYSFAARPAFIWGAVEELPVVQREAGLRLGMFLIAQRLEAFRAETGHYPAALGDIGEAVEGLQYRVVSDSLFELRSDQAGPPIVFRSDASVDVFLGSSVTVIQDRR